MENSVFLKLFQMSAFKVEGGQSVREGVVKVITEKFAESVPNGASAMEVSAALTILIMSILDLIGATDDEFVEKYMRILKDDVINAVHLIRKR